MNDCIFCGVVAKTIPSYIICEDEHSLALLNIDPINPGHAVIIPRQHYKDFFDTPSEVLTSMSELIKKVGPVIKDIVGADAINIGINNGSSAGQVIFHLHIHLIPRFETDGLKSWERNATMAFPDKDELLEKIKTALA